jgi:hypothetical protein
MDNFLGNFVSLMSVPVFYFQNLVTLLNTECRGKFGQPKQCYSLTVLCQLCAMNNE